MGNSKNTGPEENTNPQQDSVRLLKDCTYNYKQELQKVERIVFGDGLFVLSMFKGAAVTVIMWAFYG